MHKDNEEWLKQNKDSQVVARNCQNWTCRLLYKLLEWGMKYQGILQIIIYPWCIPCICICFTALYLCSCVCICLQSWTGSGCGLDWTFFVHSFLKCKPYNCPWKHRKNWSAGGEKENSSPTAFIIGRDTLWTFLANLVDWVNEWWWMFM